MVEPEPHLHVVADDEQAEDPQPLNNQLDAHLSKRYAEAVRERLQLISESQRWIGYDAKQGLWVLTKAKSPIVNDATEWGDWLVEATDADPDLPQAERVIRIDFANKLRKRSWLTRMLFFLTERSDIVLRTAALDSHPHLLHCENGVLNLNTMKFKDIESGGFDPKDLLTLSTRTRYIPGAKSELWTNYLRTAVPCAKTRAYLARVAGYTLLGAPTQETFVHLHGPPGTGKSTFVYALQQAFGDHATTAGKYCFLQDPRGGGGARSDRLVLRGKRLVVTPEVPRKSKFDDEFLNMFTSAEPYSVRGEYDARPTIITPMGVLFIVSNYRPSVTSDALWRRLHEVSFDRVVDDEHRIDGLRQKFAESEHREAILAWAIRGLKDYIKRGALLPTDAMLRAAKEYEEEENPLSTWLAAKCTEDLSDKTEFKHLYASYTRFVKFDEFSRPMSSLAFGKRLSMYKRSKSNSKVFVRGLVLKAHERAMIEAPSRLEYKGK